MARKVRVLITIAANITLEEGETVDEAISEMDYELTYSTDDAENRIETIEVRDYEVVDSK